jgi:hypothetical protein
MEIFLGRSRESRRERAGDKFVKIHPAVFF